MEIYVITGFADDDDLCEEELVLGYFLNEADAIFYCDHNRLSYYKVTKTSLLKNTFINLIL